MSHHNLPLLSKSLVASPDFRETAIVKGIHIPAKDVLQLKEKFVTFGEGNFVRSFIYWMIHRMNLQAWIFALRDQ